MNSQKLGMKINEIYRRYTIEELREMFGKRLDDELFASVGVLQMSVAQQRNCAPHIAVWVGYELLMGKK